MVFRISTRSRSLLGAHPQEIRYSCTRNSRPKAKISAPRWIVAARDLRRREILLQEFVRDQGKRDSRQKQKQRRRKRSAQLRIHEEAALARRSAEPRVIAMGLEHQQAGQSAHPVDIGEAGFGSVGRGHARFARAVYGSRQPKTQEVYPEVQVKIPLSSRELPCFLAGLAADFIRESWFLRHRHKFVRFP